MIAFGNYAPDASDFNAGIMPYMRNAQPKQDGWMPTPSLAAYSSAVPARPRGAALARRSDSGYSPFVATSSNIYVLDPATKGWTSRGSGYSLALGHSWGWVQFGSTLIACHLNDNLQYVDVDGSSSFAELAAIKCRNLCIIGANVFALGLSGEPNAVQWCGTEDASFWTVGEKGADKQTFPDGGEALFGVSGERGGFIIQRHAVRQVVWQPGNVFNFAFYPIANIGVVGKDAACQYDKRAFFLSDGGFKEMVDGVIKSIGKGRVDRAFLAEVNKRRLSEVQCAIDPLNNVVRWTYPSESYEGDGFDRVIGYDWELDRWFREEIEIELLSTAATPGETLESLDNISASLDDWAISLDSPAWTDGVPVYTAYASDYKLSLAQGANMDAVFETADVELFPGYRSFVSSASLVTDCEAPTLQVGTKDKRSSPVVWSSEIGMERDGSFSARSEGKLIRFRANLSGDWDVIHGLTEIDGKQGGAV